jgi:ankyrin repeat protein
MLLAAGADPNARLDNGANALMLASQSGHAGVIRALLVGKADVNAKAGNGATALMLASKYRHQEVVKLLKEAGAK